MLILFVRPPWKDMWSPLNVGITYQRPGPGMVPSEYVLCGAPNGAPAEISFTRPSLDCHAGPIRVPPFVTPVYLLIISAPFMKMLSVIEGSGETLPSAFTIEDEQGYAK